MKDMLVKINEEDALKLLVDRLRTFWTQDNDIVDLYSQMWESAIDNGLFDGQEFDPMVIVDNDYVNWCGVVCKGDENFDKIKAVYEEQGLGDCSCEDCDGSYIEATNEDHTLFLIRW